MQSHCFIADIQCSVVFKTLAGSDVVGVWWVNPAKPSQILHLGQYHLHEHAWYDVRRHFGVLFCSDAQCAESRPAIPLSANDIAAIRAYAQQLLNKTHLNQQAA